MLGFDPKRWNPILGIPANPDDLDQLIIWNLNSPYNWTPKKGTPMQVQWTIQIRCDFKDQDKNLEIDKTVVEHTVRLLAMMQLLCDGQKPEACCFSDDFYHGQKHLKLQADTLLAAEAEYGDKVVGGEVSEELQAAVNAITKAGS